MLKTSALVLFLVAALKFLPAQNTGNATSNVPIPPAASAQSADENVPKTGSADSVAVPNSPCSANDSIERVAVQDVVGGKLINKVAPKYPKRARRNRIQGVVVICVTIGKDGKVRDLRAASGPEELVPAAMDAVKKWRYQPYQLKGEIVEVDTVIRIVFELDAAAN